MAFTHNLEVPVVETGVMDFMDVEVIMDPAVIIPMAGDLVEVVSMAEEVVGNGAAFLVDLTLM